MNTQTAQIIPFKIESNEIRVVADDQGEPWFVANDVCAVLGYKNTSKAIADHCREKGITKRYTLTEKGEQELLYINEGNLYRLIIKCRLPVAERLEALVCDEILPSLRKTGSYTTPRPKKPRLVHGDGLSAEQQEAVIAHHRALLDAVPRELRNNLAIKLWSTIKAKYGVTYKKVDPSEFDAIITLMNDAAAESERQHNARDALPHNASTEAHAPDPAFNVAAPAFRKELEKAHKLLYRWYEECEEAIENAGGKLPPWPAFDNENLAYGLMWEILYSTRVMAVFDTNMNLRLLPIEPGEIVTSVDEFPSHVMSADLQQTMAIMEACVSRLRNLPQEK